MNIRIPQATQAARLLKKFFGTQGIQVTHVQALEAVARMHGYQDLHAMQADARFADAPVLRPMSSNEFDLREGQHSVWIGVDGISVSVVRNDEGVSVDLYAKGHEDESLTSTYLHFSEAAEVAEDAEEEEGETDAPTGLSQPVKEFFIGDVHGVMPILDNDVRSSMNILDDHPWQKIEQGTPGTTVVDHPAFEPAPVDWSLVSKLESISHIVINGGPIYEMESVSFKAMNTLGFYKDLSAHLRKAQLDVFEYLDDIGELRSIKLGLLQKAFEHTQGVITLINGWEIELFYQNRDMTTYCRVSPQQEGFYPDKP